MKRIIILGISCFFLTGCTVDYNLIIEENTFKEDISVYTTNVSELDEIQTTYYSRTYRTLFDTIRQMPISIYYDDDNSNSYNRTLIDEDNQYGANFTYDFTFSDLSRSSAMNKCYTSSNIVFTENNGIYTLRTTSGCELFEYEKIFKELNIRITVNNLVIENNADQIEGNTYIWNINQDNYSTKLINISYDSTQSSNNSEISDSNDVVLTWITSNIFLICGIILIVIIIIVVIVVVRKKNAQKDVTTGNKK